jgi:heme exporter protein D
MIEVVADWTTAGPYKDLSWLTIAYTILTMIALIIVMLEARSAVLNLEAVLEGNKNGGMRILTTSSVVRSILRLATVGCFVATASSAVWFYTGHPEFRQWFRWSFIISSMLAPVLLSALALNDLTARRKLLILIDQYYESQKGGNMSDVPEPEPTEPTPPDGGGDED